MIAHVVQRPPQRGQKKSSALTQSVKCEAEVALERSSTSSPAVAWQEPTQAAVVQPRPRITTMAARTHPTMMGMRSLEPLPLVWQSLAAWVGRVELYQNNNQLFLTWNAFCDVFPDLKASS